MASQGFKPFKTLSKIAVKPNSKIPVFSKWNKIEQQREFINSEIYNVGIPTGSINNLTGLDIDNINDFKKCIEKYEEPQTVKQLAPSGGAHYIFFNGSSNLDDYLIKNYLKNKTKYRN